MITHGEELEHLLAEIAAQGDRPIALATIVATRGSTYRHAGARLLVTDDGSWFGNISGGCLEGEVLEVGGRVIDRDAAEVVEYDLTADDEAIWGWGLGCNGAIRVLVEPGGPARTAAALLRDGIASGRPHALVTVVAGSSDLPAGSHLLVHEDGTAAGDGRLDRPEVREVATAALREDRSGVRSLTLDGASLELFLELRRPPLRLLVCGAGHDAVPVVAQAAALGWRPVVVDDRSSFLTRERFPQAAGLVRTPPAEAAEAASVDDHTAVVIMSHNFLRDVDYLASFAASPALYVGVLGPSRRLQRLYDHLARDGRDVDESDRRRIHGPAGLDLGAEGPTEIALAICAEIVAVTRGHTGVPLRERAGRIHEPAAERRGD